MAWGRKRDTKSDLGKYATALITKVFSLDAQAQLSGNALEGADAILVSYWETDVNWQLLWNAANQVDLAYRRAHPQPFDFLNDQGIPPYGKDPYWITNSMNGRQVPISALAFWGIKGRGRVAQDRATDSDTLTTILDDPNGPIRLFATMELARRGD